MIKRFNIYVVSIFVLAILACVIYFQSRINNLQSKIDSQMDVPAVESNSNLENIETRLNYNPVKADIYHYFEGPKDLSEYKISYQGIMWVSSFNPDLYYFLPLLDSILFSRDYVWMEKRDCASFINIMNSLKSIRAEGKSVDANVIGFEFMESFNSKIKGLPSDIVELWFEFNDDKWFLHIKNESGWVSYEIMGDDLFLERKLMKQLIESIEKKKALETY